MSILLAETGLMPLPDQWLLHAATFLNAIAVLPPTSLYRKMALDACTWAACVSKAVRGTGYDPSIRQGAMDHHDVDLQVLSSHLRQRKDAVWECLNICPRTCPTEKSRLCTYKSWFARPAGRHARSLSLEGFWTCLFHACSPCCASGWAVTSCPRTQDAGFVFQDKTGCV